MCRARLRVEVTHAVRSVFFIGGWKLSWFDLWPVSVGGPLALLWLLRKLSALESLTIARQPLLADLGSTEVSLSVVGVTKVVFSWRVPLNLHAGGQRANRQIDR